MQNIRQLILTQRSASVSKINYLLRRCLTYSTATSVNPTSFPLNPSSLTLVDSSVSSCINGRLLSTTKCGLTTIYRHQPVRYASSGSLPSHRKITLPALSPTMETGTLRSWSKKEGDKIVEDILAEIETDKATLGFESIDEGYLAKILIPGGSKDVPVGKLCAIIVNKEEDVAAFKDFTDDGGETPAKDESADQKAEKKEKEPAKKEDSTSKSKEQPKKEKAQTSSSTKGDRIVVSPLARKLAEEKGIDLASVQGTGPNSRIIAEDIEKFVKEGGTKAGVKKAKDHQQVSSSRGARREQETAARTGGYDDEQVSDIRAENARRVTESKTTIPHYYLTVEIEVDEILKLRGKLNDLIAPKSKDGTSKSRGVTLNDFIIKAAALACKKRPETNSVWMEKTIRQYETVDINIAINTDAGVLMTPILYNVDQKGVSAISKDVSQLSEKANAGKLSDNELEMGTFTISNLGMYGITNFSPVIYPQQSANLAIGSIENRILPSSDPSKNYRQASVLTVSLSCDHRVIDGAIGAQWLQEFKQYLENPGSMIL
ncbi:unnamed protein product [Adineta ricciae]|uniref:dihydrolipoyllysine-residue acetyltransferase n=1 Tax=Adineta ricciae TaxID=249248 RepID=A0A814I231_ADIRI|nr:unnamed protein product [Adineta ricciae]